MKFSACASDIRQIFHPGHAQAPNQRLFNLMKRSTGYQLGVAVSLDRENANALRKRLLEQYLEQHGELPPENRAI